MKKLPYLLATCCAAVWAASLSLTSASPLTELRRIEQSSAGSARRTWDELTRQAGDQDLLLPQAAEGKKMLHGYRKQVHWHLFFADLTGLDSGNATVIQRIRRKESSWLGSERKESVQYLVESHRLQNGRLKRLDQHSSRLALENFKKREIVWDCEIGLGSVASKEVTPNSWPFESNKLSKVLQAYSENAGLYDEVKFSQSRRFSYSVTLTASKSTFECKELDLASEATP